MNKGLDIKILGVTVGHHLDMISRHVKEGGDIDWLLLDKGGSQIVTRKVFGATYKVEFYYCSYEEILVAECVK